MASGICFTVSEAKTRLGITGTTFDASLSSVCDGVNSAIVSFLGFSPDETEITEYLDTKGQAEVGLRRWPVDSVTSVYLDETGYYGDGDDAFASDTLLTAGTDYVWAYVAGSRKVGVLRRINAKWPYRMGVGPNRLGYTLEPCPGCLKVVYTVDNTDVMAAAKEAGLMEVAARWASRLGTGAVLSESVDGYSISVTPPQHLTKTAGPAWFVSPLAEVMLRPFRVTPLR